MKDRKRLLLSSLGIMSGVAIVVSGVTMWVLYCAAFDQQRARLVDSAKNEAHLIEAIARAHARRLGGGCSSDVLAATLGEVADAHAHDEGFGDTGEFTLARLEDGHIIFVLSHRHEDDFGSTQEHTPVPMSGWYAEPMRRALRGAAGTIVGPDYRGERVLAAYQPISEVNLGIVAKMDLTEIHAPFVRAGTIAAGVALLVIAAGGWLFFCISDPLVKRIEEGQARMRSIVESAADGIICIDEHGIVESFNTAAENIFHYTADEIIGENISTLMPAPYRDEHDGYLQRYLDTGKKNILGARREVVGKRRDDSTVPIEIGVSEVRFGTRRMFTGIVRDITQRKRAEAQLESLHKQLLVASRQAGMAEIATGVLHNVGNVLNSVNVSASVVGDKLRKSKVSSLAKAVGLMREHAHDLGTFITEDEKGKKLPAYLDKLAEHLGAEQSSMMSELQELTKNVEHIKKIVTAQQSHAGAYGVVETVPIAEVVDDALTVNATSFERYGIEMVREYADLPPIALDKQKLLQIMVNLVRNAKHAVLDGDCEDKRLTLRIRRQGDAQVCIEVIDNGVGIIPDNLAKIFSHGFTTKEDGHGFGLHSAALAAKEMGGSLNVHSDGPGTGATFTLDLPFKPVGTEVAT